MAWRYRVMKHDEGAKEPPHLAIHEVYDDPPGWTTNPVAVGGESIEKLREVLIMMRRALAEPVLDYEDTPGQARSAPSGGSEGVNDGPH